MLKEMRMPEDELKILIKFISLPPEQLDFILQNLRKFSPQHPH